MRNFALLAALGGGAALLWYYASRQPRSPLVAPAALLPATLATPTPTPPDDTQQGDVWGSPLVFGGETGSPWEADADELEDRAADWETQGLWDSRARQRLELRESLYDLSYAPGSGAPVLIATNTPTL